MRRKLVALAIIAILLCASSAFAANDGYQTTYTYNYDYWSDIRESPDAYEVDRVLYSATLGLDMDMSRPQSLFIRNNDIYVCDTGNNRILQIRKDGTRYSVIRCIDSITGTAVATFNAPSDVYVDTEENIYVCDTNNNRVVMVDKNLQFIKEFTKPDDSTFDQSLSFLPNKLVVDVSGRAYVLATNVNKGLVKYEADTTFTGYIGANKVTYSLYEYIWKSYILSEEQKAQQTAFVPTEYSNIYMDRDGFIYATNMVFSEYDLLYGNAKPIRRLNGIGNDILIKNDRYAPVGDLYWVEGTEKDGPSKFVDITVLDDDIYIALDKTRGRLFGYDQQGVMLWTFGTKGNNEGAFLSAISIEHMGNDLYCLDQNEGSITVFTPTEYGKLIYEANDAYTKGDYDGSAELWREVLRRNANYNLAFRGIGRSLLRQGSYKEAMDYFKMAHDRKNYGRAFKLYRKDWVEQNILWIVLVIVVIVIVRLIMRRYAKIKAEMSEYERIQVNK